MHLIMKVKMDMENLEKLVAKQQERLKELAKKVVSDMYVPKHIIHNWKTDETIVIWKNGDKTKVKLREGETYSEYFAFTAALAKYLFGSNTKIKKIIKMTESPLSSNKHRNEKRTECLIEKCTPKKKMRIKNDNHRGHEPESRET